MKMCRINKILTVAFIVALLALSIVLPVIEYKGNGRDSISSAFTSSTTIASQATSIDELVTDGKFDDKRFWSLIDKICGQTGSDNSNYLTRLKDKTLTSANFRTNNGNLDIVVTIGGYQWTATYLSPSSNDDGDPILTLWLANTSSSISGAYGAFASATVGNYPSSMYGTSYFRAVVLNNGGDYATSISALTSCTQSDSNIWAKFTMADASGSISEFIEVPDNISWQHEQHCTVSAPEFPLPMYNCDGNNESLDFGASKGNTGSFLNKAGYDAWANDKLWIPSGAELGLSNVSGLWKTSINQRAAANAYITRSPNCNYPNDMYEIGTSGTVWDTAIQSTTVQEYYRPAFHLNLRKVADSLCIPEPKYFETTYNGEIQTLETLKNDETVDPKIDWYHSSYADPSQVKVEYLSSTGSVISGNALPKNVGTYGIRFTIVDADNNQWWDHDTNTSLVRTVNFKIIPKKLSVDFNSSASPPTAKPSNLCDSDSAIADTILRIRYTGITGAQSYDSYKEPSNVGNYNATVEINPSITGSSNYVLDKEYKEQILISTKQLSLPNITTELGDNVWCTYSGDEWVYMISYDSDLMEISIADAYKDSGKFEWDGEYIYVTNAGEYKDALKVKLKNPYDKVSGEGRYVWDSNTNDVGDKYLSFTIEKMELKLDFRTDTSDGKINAPIGSSFTVSLVLNDGTHNYKPVNRDRVHIAITASRDGTATPVTVYDDLTISSSTANSVSVDLNISSLRMAGSYALKLIAEDTNYNVTMVRDVTLVLTRATQSPDLIWWLMENGNDTDYSKNAAVGATNVDFDVTDLVYNGKAYSFYVTAPFGYEIYEDVQTLKVGNNLNYSSVIDAGDYISTVVIIKSDDSTAQPTTYQLNWSIAKAKFDLTNVKWLNDGKVEYNDGADVSPEIDSSTLPAGLLVDRYGNVNVGNSVGDGGLVSVTFKFDDGYSDNYVLPEKGGKDTNYTFTGSGDFEWEKEWDVVPAVIKLEWIEKQVTDSNDVPFNVLILKDERVDGKVDYVFYETDNRGNINTSKAPLTLEEILVSATDRKYYKAFPTIKSGYANNYTFPENTSENDYYSSVFIVGGGSSSVSVALNTDKYEYNHGRPINIKVDITGAATLNNLTFTYYKGDVVDDANKLDGAPTEVGNYVVVIKSNTATVVLSGTTQFEFEVTKSIVSTEWKTEAKPPVLNLKYGQINGVEYEILDSNNNPVTSISQITAGDYAIRAIIKDTKNYIFDDDTYETEYVYFTVREDDQVMDPNDPSNPFYPQEDPDNPSNPGGNNPGDDENGGGSVLDKIKEFFDKLIESHFPLWQVITMAVSTLLALIFMIKAIQYGNRAKKAKNETKKIKAKAYATFLPIFSTETVLLGLSNKIWSIMAFAFVGLALLMFIVALIARHSWKKAELVKENAMSEAGINAQNGNQLATVNGDNSAALMIADLRREMKETLTQVGGQGVAQTSDSSIAIIQEMRREMEERRREDEERHRKEMEMLREEQRRENERREEEQAKRDEAMKLMLANMMGRQQGEEGFAYASMDDTDLLVQKVIAGLLPAVQQMMPEATAYLAAPSEENEELKALVEEQSEEIRNMAETHSEEMRAMSDQISELQEQLAAALSQERADAVILPDNNDEILAQMNALQEQIANLSNGAGASYDNSDEMRAMSDELTALREQIANLGNQSVTVVAPEGNNGEIMAEMNAMREQIAKLSQTQYDTVILDEEDDDFDDEEEWDCVLDEDDEEEFAESVIVESDGTVRKVYPNFRMRLKQSSDKNREWYTAIKNLFCSQKGVTYRVYKRVEKIRYQGNVVAVIGIAKRSIKLWLALKPYEYDARRYHHKDVSDKPRFVDVPLYVRVGSDRALTRAQELILALFQEQAMEARKRYTDRSIQELIFTLKYNKLLTNKLYKRLLCESIHVHDCNALDNETAEKCIEKKNVDFIDNRVIETVKLDDIDAKFQDGNRVTLDRLRKVGLVSANCTGYNVAAGHRLTKPLIIVANDFSVEAVKMIALTGGRVIKLTLVSK